jgi:hypothetical protein
MRSGEIASALTALTYHALSVELQATRLGTPSVSNTLFDTTVQFDPSVEVRYLAKLLPSSPPTKNVPALYAIHVYSAFSSYSGVDHVAPLLVVDAIGYEELPTIYQAPFA